MEQEQITTTIKTYKGKGVTFKVKIENGVVKAVNVTKTRSGYRLFDIVREGKNGETSIGKTLSELISLCNYVLLDINSSELSND